MRKKELEKLIKINKENDELRKARNKAESEVLRQKTLRQNMKLELDAFKRELEAERMKKYENKWWHGTYKRAAQSKPH